MTITLDLQPDVEQGLMAKAAASGLSVDDYLKDLIVRETHIAPEPVRRTGQELIDACAKVRGLLSDEEVDRLFSRTASISRAVDFE